jgi:hypothetical protein
MPGRLNRFSWEFLLALIKDVVAFRRVAISHTAFWLMSASAALLQAR